MRACIVYILPYTILGFASGIDVQRESQRKYSDHDLSKSYQMRFPKAFATHLPAFTTSSHPHASPLFYPGSEQSLLSYKPVLPY